MPRKTKNAKPPRPRVTVFRDGLVARRQPELLEPQAAAIMVRSMNNLPTILEAWAHPVPRSRRRMVCWLPASQHAQAEMEASLRRAEESKGRKEGSAFVWSPTVFGPKVRSCYNPRSGCAYLVTHEGGDRYRCQCPRYQSAGLCKHTCAARFGVRELTLPL